MPEKHLMELSHAGRIGVALPASDVPAAEAVPAELLRGELRLPELSQLDVVRHFTRLSQLNWSIDTHMYPLGSCTMKLNPKVNDAIAAMPGLRRGAPDAAGRGRAGRARRDVRAAARSRGDQRHGGVVAGAARGRAGRAVRRAHHQGLPGLDRRTSHDRPRAGLGARDESRDRLDGRVRRRRREAAAGRRYGPRGAARRARRSTGRPWRR